MPMIIPFIGGSSKKVNQFTTLSITPLGNTKAGSITNQSKFTILDALAEDSPSQVIDIARSSNMQISVCVRYCQELVNGGYARVMAPGSE